MSGNIRIAICDAIPAFRIGVKHILEQNPAIAVTLETSKPSELLEKQAISQLDVVLVDIGPDVPDNIMTVAKLKAIRQGVKIIVLMSCCNLEFVKQSLDLGVAGIHNKNANPAEIIDAVDSVLNGVSSMGPCVTTALLDHLADPEPEKTNTLSHREEIILDLIAEGKSNSDIAKELCITISTVKFHVSSILGKLDAKNRTEAAMIWNS